MAVLKVVGRAHHFQAPLRDRLGHDRRPRLEAVDTTAHVRPDGILDEVPLLGAGVLDGRLDRINQLSQRKGELVGIFVLDSRLSPRRSCGRAPTLEEPAAR